MDYFELYGLPLNFNPDLKLVKQKFYELSKKYHPDFFINQSDEKQQEVLELSTLNNKAFQVLNDPQKRIHYILSLKGLLEEGENYKLPQSFLMEMMEVNEALMDLQFDPDEARMSQVKQEIDNIEASLHQELESLAAAYDHQNSDAQETTLLSIKDLYYRSKYLYRIRESLSKIK